MATHLLSCLIVLTFLLSSTGPALAARPPQARDGAAPRPLAEPPALPAPGANAAQAIDASIAALLAPATSVAAGGLTPVR